LDHTLILDLPGKILLQPGAKENFRVLPASFPDDSLGSYLFRNHEDEALGDKTFADNAKRVQGYVVDFVLEREMAKAIRLPEHYGQNRCDWWREGRLSGEMSFTRVAIHECRDL
jgi:hypothetical protein